MSPSFLSIHRDEFLPNSKSLAESICRLPLSFWLILIKYDESSIGIAPHIALTQVVVITIELAVIAPIPERTYSLLSSYSSFNPITYKILAQLHLHRILHTF